MLFVGLVRQNGRSPVADKTRILFLCSGNSCRSQMAEGWARCLVGDAIEPYSAGSEPHGLNSYAVRVMAEVGVDISSHTSKAVSDISEKSFDYVITVCDGAAGEACPYYPGEAKFRLHHGFDDPPRLVVGWTDEEKILNCYRRVRDEIKAFILTLPQLIQE